jgi:hypothetical protein
MIDALLQLALSFSNTLTNMSASIDIRISDTAPSSAMSPSKNRPSKQC